MTGATRSSLRPWRRERQSWLAVPILALAAGLAVLFSGWGGSVDQQLRVWRDQLRVHDASGEIAIVEVDARSLAALDQWPWPRRHHGQLIDRLADSGASLIAFDVNFEVRSNPADDQALASAIERAGGLVALPIFLQPERAGSSQSVEALPYEAFRNNAFLAGVNVYADEDGLVRSLPLGTIIADQPRPSMASLLAESAGDVDRRLDIDFSIDPATIPRISFIDVLNGRVDPSLIAGKKIIIGGTAADMMDRYTVPIYGVMPGVVVQALAAETILAGGAPAVASGFWPLVLAFLLSLLACCLKRAAARAVGLCLGAFCVLLLPLAAEHWLALSFPLAPALAGLLVAGIGLIGLQIAARSRERSLIDAETGFPNQRALIAALAEQQGQAVVVVRIKRFTALAAGLGTAAAVTLLHRVADRLRTAGDRQIYRIDEHSMAWLEPDGASPALDQHLSGLAALMRSPVECGRLVDVTLGIGVAAHRSGGGRSDLKQQVANAALAADRALRDKLAFVHFTETDEETGWHLSLLGELSEAMAAGEVWNAYQPKLDLATGRIIGVETLVRWSHRERGLVGPDQFIPLVEASGRASDLTAYVLHQALADARRWREFGHDLSIAVNVSASLLEDQSFIIWLRETLRSSGVPAEKVIVEITESVAVRNVEQAAAALDQWRSLGIGISIDDYGTGQSSLGYLQRLPSTELKIDKSFITNLAEDGRNGIMVRSTVALAHQLGMKVVAEGVEDAATLTLLREIECDVAQGYHIAKPMPAAELELLLAGSQSLAA